MNECQRTGMCTNGLCINIDGGYRCQCDHGFQESSGGTACIGDLVFHWPVLILATLTLFCYWYHARISFKFQALHRTAVECVRTSMVIMQPIKSCNEALNCALFNMHYFTLALDMQTSVKSFHVSGDQENCPFSSLLHGHCDINLLSTEHSLFCDDVQN